MNFVQHLPDNYYYKKLEFNSNNFFFLYLNADGKLGK